MRLATCDLRLSRGSTLIEMTVVIFLLMILASVILPSVTAIERNRQDANTEETIWRLPTEAINEAEKSADPVTLSVRGDQLVMTRTPIDGAEEQVKQVDMGQSLHVEHATLNAQPSDSGSWQWTAYPDGTCDSGGLEFSLGTSQRSLVIDHNGKVQWLHDKLPDPTSERWESGMLQIRSQGTGGTP